MSNAHRDNNTGLAPVSILRFRDGVSAEADDLVAVETPLVLKVLGVEFVTLMYTPPGARELSAGYLAGEGVISSMDDVSAIVESQGEVDVRLSPGVEPPPPARTRVLTSGCGGGVTFSHPGGLKGVSAVVSGARFSYDGLCDLMDGLRVSSPLFEKTGGTHAAALSGGGNIAAAAEDIGRHNAVDKALGAALIGGLNLSAHALGVTGRVSSEILLKCVRVGIPCVVSRGAPTSLAVELAERFGVTLAGFARCRRFNAYSNGHRIEK